VTRARGEEGSASLELVLVMPVLLLLLGFAVAGGRLVEAHMAVDGAAGDAARAASLAFSSTQAEAAARSTAGSDLAGHGLACSALSVAVDTTDFVPGGSVGVQLSCTAQLSNLVPGVLFGHRTVSAHAASVIDTYRAGPASP
jgi:Flp pilus assembly protein TadG